MWSDIAANWQAGLFVLIAITYFELMDYLNRRYARKKPLSDYEMLAILARVMECSEYDIFEEAAKFWNISANRVQSDFKSYLLADHIPHYVLDFLRKFAKDIVLKHQQRSFPPRSRHQASDQDP
jgi:hypothetical protein